MKKILSVLIVLVMALSLSACGQTSHTQPDPTVAPTAESSAPVAAPAEPAPAEPSILPETAGAPVEAATPMELAESCVGKSVEDLYALIGEPDAADYAPSCLGSGEDGILEYADFLVYTYREGESERVDTVLPR